VSFGVGSLSKRGHSRPAMAGGIQSFDGAFPKVCRVDSRFRGNDCGLFATSLPREEGDGCYLRQKDRPAPPGPRLECLKQKQFRGQRAFEAHRDTLLH